MRAEFDPRYDRGRVLGDLSCALAAGADGLTDVEAMTAQPALIADGGQRRRGPSDRAAHLTIVFTALVVSREVQNRAGLAISNVIRQLRPLRTATIISNGVHQAIPPAIPAQQQALIAAIRNPRSGQALRK